MPALTFGQQLAKAQALDDWHGNSAATDAVLCRMFAALHQRRQQAASKAPARPVVRRLVMAKALGASSTSAPLQRPTPPAPAAPVVTAPQLRAVLDGAVAQGRISGTQAMAVLQARGVEAQG